MKHLLDLGDFKEKELKNILNLAKAIKKNQKKYSKTLYEKVLVMMFEKPSLRTRLSFDVAMTQLGGHAVFYDISNSPLHKGKESISDTSKVMSRMANFIMARTYSHAYLAEFASYSSVPVINGLTNMFHPCQILGDLLTISEKVKGKFSVAYYGDCQTNVAHSWIRAANILDFKLYLCGPSRKKYLPLKTILGKAMNVSIINNPEKIPPTDIVYTDSWMSYQVPKSEQKQRLKDLSKYRVDEVTMRRAKKKSYFMHDLPALRGMEVTSEVIDGKQSIILDQAENRIHVEKGILVWLWKNR
jgi:ornithine carbamoyltransferase